MQWLAKDQAGFIGSLKAAWVTLEREKLANVIICGSSNRFFCENVGGEERLLRGVATRSPIWVPPFSPCEVRKLCFPSWNIHEVAFVYLMVGGIPFYLNRFKEELGFVHAINQGVFSKESIFIEEIDEILNLEFNKAGTKTVKYILENIGTKHASQADIRKKLKLAPSTVSDVFEKLLDYEILFPIIDLGMECHQRYKTQGKETKYRLKDFYLRFFFSVLQKLEQSVKSNQEGSNPIFPNRVITGKKFYVADFTGAAFERFVEFFFETAKPNSRVAQKINLYDKDFQIGAHKNPKSQIDVVINHKTDRIVRTIECKWGAESLKHLDEVCFKTFPLSSTQRRMNIIVTSYQPSQAYFRKAKYLGVKVLTLDDFFS